MAKSNKKTIAVFGATGRQGGAAVHHLRQRGLSVRALTRDPNKPEAQNLAGRGTEVMGCDLNDEALVMKALDGVDGVLSIQSLEGGVELEMRQGLNVVDAAKRLRIDHLIYSSVCGADDHTGVPHFDSKYKIEESIRQSGLRYTILQPVFFMENWLGMRAQIESGMLQFPLDPDTRLQMIAVDDIGGVAALAFDRPGQWQGYSVELAGDEMSMTELAEAFGRMSGREVRYDQVSWDQFEQRVGHDITLMFRWFQDVGYHVDIAELREDFPNLTSFEKWLHSKWTKTLTA